MKVKYKNVYSQLTIKKSQHKPFTSSWYWSLEDIGTKIYVFLRINIPVEWNGYDRKLYDEKFYEIIPTRFFYVGG